MGIDWSALRELKDPCNLLGLPTGNGFVARASLLPSPIKSPKCHWHTAFSSAAASSAAGIYAMERFGLRVNMAIGATGNTIAVLMKFAAAKASK